MRKASAWLLEKGIQTPSPSPDLIPAGNNETLAENLHGNWNIERGHFRTTDLRIMRTLAGSERL